LRARKWKKLRAVSLVAELKQHETSLADASAQEKGESTQGQVDRTQICCVAARTPLDFAAATMLAHLLDKDGFGPKVVSYEDVSRGRIGDFDAQGFSTTCVCYIDMSSSPSPLRFLLRLAAAAGRWSNRRSDMAA
jgi:hypothetical protein